MSSIRVSSILLVFLLLPAIVFSLKCYKQDPPGQGDPKEGECDGGKKCVKQWAFGDNGVTVVYGCTADANEPNAQKPGPNGVRSVKLVCDTDLCNGVDVAQPDDPNPPKPAPAPVDPTDDSLEHGGDNGSGLASTSLCLMGMLVSWLLFTN